MELGQIIHGHFNEITGQHKNLKHERIEICKTCPIYSPILGGICNNKLWINSDTQDVSTVQKDGYVRGCGCRIQAKASLPNAKCIINKW